MSDDHAEYVLAQINEDLRAENKKLRGEIKDDRQGAIDHLEDALYRAQTENVRLRGYIKHAECYGDWCGKSPTNKSSGLCQACEARKALE